MEDMRYKLQAMTQVTIVKESFNRKRSLSCGYLDGTLRKCFGVWCCMDMRSQTEKQGRKLEDFDMGRIQNGEDKEWGG